MTEPDAADCDCKVGRVATRRGLAGLDEALVRHRRAESASLRELANLVNRRVLSAALTMADIDNLDDLFGAISGDQAVEAVYDALTADTEPERTARVRTRLEQRGVDVGAVEDDWVSHPTVGRHLRDCLDVDTARSATITLDDAVDTIEWARTRAAGVIARTFQRLATAGLVRTGELDAAVTVQLTCSTCGHTYRPRELLERGGCACQPPGDGPDASPNTSRDRER